MLLHSQLSKSESLWYLLLSQLNRWHKLRLTRRKGGGKPPEGPNEVTHNHGWQGCVQGFHQSSHLKCYFGLSCQAPKSSQWMPTVCLSDKLKASGNEAPTNRLSSLPHSPVRGRCCAQELCRTQETGHTTQKTLYGYFLLPFSLNFCWDACAIRRFHVY